MAFLDETGLAELWELIKAEDDKAPKIAIGHYMGTGTFGSDNKNSLTFDFVPKVVWILKETYCTASNIGDSDDWTVSKYSSFVLDAALPVSSMLSRTSTMAEAYALTEVAKRIAVSFSNGNKTVSWYGKSAAYQLNSAKDSAYTYIYHYIAIG